MPGSHWTDQEIGSLIHQVVLENKPLPQLTLPGKTEAAINNQRRRLKDAGLLDGASVRRAHRPALDDLQITRVVRIPLLANYVYAILSLLLKPMLEQPLLALN